MAGGHRKVSQVDHRFSSAGMFFRSGSSFASMFAVKPSPSAPIRNIARNSLISYTLVPSVPRSPHFACYFREIPKLASYKRKHANEAAREHLRRHSQAAIFFARPR